MAAAAVPLILLLYQKQILHIRVIKTSIYGNTNNLAEINKKISIPIEINTQDKTINAAEAYLTFDPKAIRVESVSKSDSFFTIWITDEPKFSNEKGEISFAGGLPNPGFKGKGVIGSVEITPLKTGWQTLTFDARTRLLLNDGLGTESPLEKELIRIKVK